MSRLGWDTRRTVATRPGSRDRLALVVAASLLVLVVLAAFTGKVLALNPPTLSDSSPTADHIGRQAPASSPEPPDPESLFLDLPDPPTPKAPKATEVSEASGGPGGSEVPPQNQSSQPASSPVSSSTSKEADVKEQVGPGRTGQADGAASGIPLNVADFRPLPPEPTVRPGSGNAEDLLADPDCEFSDVARADLEAGVVDEYLISALQAVCRKHSIYVNVFKTGHAFGPGLAEGPEIPAGYGNAGGYPNTHYFGRAADIWEVDGKPVEGNGADPAVVSVGRILAGLPVKSRPDVVIGPDAWNQVLGYGPEQGWVIDGDQVALHADHLHVGYWKGDGTPPPRVFLSPEQEPFYTNTAPVRRTRDYSDKTTGATQPGPARPRPKKATEPAERPRPAAKPATRSATRSAVRSTVRSVSRSGAAKEGRIGSREKDSRQGTVTHKVQVQRTETKDNSPGPAKTRSESNKDSGKKPGDSRAQGPPQPDPDRNTKQPIPGGSSSGEESTSGPVNSMPQYSTEPDVLESEGALPGGETTSESTSVTN